MGMILRVTDKDKGDDILRVMMNRRAQNVQTEAFKEPAVGGERECESVFGAAVPDGVGSV